MAVIWDGLLKPCMMMVMVSEYNVQNLISFIDMAKWKNVTASVYKRKKDV